MTVHVAARTFIEFDRKAGTIRVYDAETGELLYTLKVHPCHH